MNGKKIVTEKNDDFISVDDRIDSGFLESHTHFINGLINEETTGKVIRWIVFENMRDDDAMLTLYINSDGGNLPDAFALIDVMRMSKAPIRTIGIGSICSSAFMIFAAGTKGHRFIGQNTTIMCHQFTDASVGKFHDLKTKLKENQRINDRMVTMLAECSDLSEREVKTKLLPPSDVWLSAEELVELGIADSIL
jgi:ATP-dependent Clp protease, protease subunit